MSRRVLGLTILVLSLVCAGPVGAQPPKVGHSDPFWRVAYWNNMTMYGPPVVEGTDANVNWDWGAGSPRPGVNADHFSARWARYLDLAAGTYRFIATSDDGVRVYVDNRLIIDEWRDQAVRTFTADIALSAGHHLVTVEFYENMGHAVAKLSWLPVSPLNWHGEYYNNRWLSGSPFLVRDDANIDFNWGYGSPSPVIPVDGFSVRWTRTMRLEPGMYRFTATTDDGVRLRVNNHLLIDAWYDQSVTTRSGDIYLSGDIPIVMEYYENGGVATARLTWTRTDGEPEPPPVDAIIVDDRDPGFYKGGSPTGWRAADVGCRGNMTWTRNNYGYRYNYNWARWYPSLFARRYYEVFVHIPALYGDTTGARYWVSHYDGFTLRSVNQSANAGRWVSLGTYRFRGTRQDYVSLSDITYEPYLSHMIAFDAVKWEPR